MLGTIFELMEGEWTLASMLCAGIVVACAAALLIMVTMVIILSIRILISYIKDRRYY